jgi:hypothetical protein
VRRVAVIQSYRSTNVPAWINHCLASVKAWAKSAGYDYRLFGDEAFAICGEDYLAQVGSNMRSITNLARLELVKDAHAHGYDWAVWIDADVLVFDPARFDLSKVQRYAFARDLTGRSYPFPKSPLFPNGGTSVGFHGGSHHQDDPNQIRRYADLNRYHVSTMAYFAEKLKEMPDGDGTMLDNSLILYGTNMGNSNQHQHYDVPHLLVGGAAGKLKGNRHVAFERKTVTTGNLLLNVMDMYGIHRDKQGDSTGRLKDL